MKIRNFLIVLTVVANKVLAGAISSDSWTLERRIGKSDTARCSTQCGSPPLDDCVKVIKVLLADFTEICETAGALTAAAFAHLNCAFTVNPSQSVENSGPSCISRKDFNSVASNLAKACPGAQSAGGCFLFSDGRSICVMSTDHTALNDCHAETLV